MLTLRQATGGNPINDHPPIGAFVLTRKHEFGQLLSVDYPKATVLIDGREVTMPVGWITRQVSDGEGRTAAQWLESARRWLNRANGWPAGSDDRAVCLADVRTCCMWALLADGDESAVAAMVAGIARANPRLRQIETAWDELRQAWGVTCDGLPLAGTFHHKEELRALSQAVRMFPGDRVWITRDTNHTTNPMFGRTPTVA